MSVSNSSFLQSTLSKNDNLSNVLQSDNVNNLYDAGDITWVMTSTALVLLMIPGVGLYYSGLVRRKSALSLILSSIIASAIVNLQWFLWGYSLVFARTEGRFIGNFNNFGFINVLSAPSIASPKIPDLLYAVYQGMFASITVAIAVGAIAERGRMLPAIIFMLIWTTVIYDPIAYWSWNPSGWMSQMGALDFAGGTPVHISSGCAALGYSIMLGKRRGYGTHELEYRPNNVVNIVTGTVFLWVGWLGFNGGSAIAANMRAVVAITVTNLSACVGGIIWCLLDCYGKGKWSVVGFCSGVIAGLVAITPGSGFVPVWSAPIFGFVGASGTNYATKLKFFFDIDDTLDIFAVHAIGGFIGNILTGIFATNDIARLDGTTIIRGGWLNHHWKQMGFQLADSLAGGLYSFVGTCIILFIMNHIPGLSLRVDEEDEIFGLDDVETGEFAYDYVELRREVTQNLTLDGLHDGPQKNTHGSNLTLDSPNDGPQNITHGSNLQKCQSQEQEKNSSTTRNEINI